MFHSTNDDISTTSSIGKHHEKSFKSFPRYSLWYFLLDLLETNDSSHLIRWTNKENLEFCLVNPKELSDLWGQLNGKGNMTYAKLSRALRYYYGKGVLEKVLNKHFHYRFIKSSRTKFAMEKKFETKYQKPEKPDCPLFDERKNGNSSASTSERLTGLINEIQCSEPTVSCARSCRPQNDEGLHIRYNNTTRSFHANHVFQSQATNIGLLTPVAVNDGRQLMESPYSDKNLFQFQDGIADSQATSLLEQTVPTIDDLPEIPNLNEFASIYEISTYMVENPLLCKAKQPEASEICQSYFFNEENLEHSSTCATEEQQDLQSLLMKFF